MGDDKNSGAIGASANYDAVILAVGFGLEKSSESSYWRNETLGQPSLDQPRRTFMVAGQGDGAMIDLLRLRISQYRQDRILEEMFLKHRALTLAIKDIYNKFGSDAGKEGLFEEFERLSEASHPCAKEFELLMGDLRRRLRRDTDAILRLQVTTMMPSLLERRGQRVAPSALNLNREPMTRGDIARKSLFSSYDGPQSHAMTGGKGKVDMIRCGKNPGLLMYSL